jgi:hypothetical protein
MNGYLGASMERPGNPSLYSYGHSQGASVIDQGLKQIPKNWYPSMHIRTLGGTTVISGSEFGSVDNAVSSHDYCSMLACPLETIRSFSFAAFGWSNPKVRYVSGSGWYDHGFLGDTYRRVMRAHGEEFRKTELNEGI